jgi:hypothetical protein
MMPASGIARNELAARKPIWLTEFSCGDQGAQPVSKQQSYMKDALANVDLLAGAGALTTLGGDYVSLPEPAACFR